MLSTLLAASATPAAAQPDEDIVVTGRPLVQAQGSESYDTQVIDRDRLTSNASGRVDDLLDEVAGFGHFRRTDSRSANPTSQGATLRGLGGNAASRALVLLDGVPIADPFSGVIPYSAIRADRLSAIRITRGGGAGPFGAGAIAGVIELQSGGIGDLPGLALHAGYGSRNGTELSGGVVQPLGAGFVSIAGGWDRGDGAYLIPARQRGPVDVRAPYNAWSANLRGVVPVGAAELQANMMVFDDHRLRGLAGTASRNRGSGASVRVVGRGDWGYEALAYIQERGFRSGFASAVANRTATSVTLNQFATPSLALGGKIEVRPPLPEGKSLSVGADVRATSGTTNELFSYVAGLPTRLRRAGGSNAAYGAFAEGSVRLGAVVVTGGGRVDRWTIRGGRLTERTIGTGAATLAQVFPDRSGVRPTARAGSRLTLSDDTALRAAAYTGFRVPTLNELYRPFRLGVDATGANAALKLETLKGVEGGADIGRAAGPRLSLTGFYNRLGDAVANVTLGAGPRVFPQVGFVAAGGAYRQRQNVDAIRVWGAEATAVLPVGPVRLSASYAWSDARVLASGVAATLNGKRPAQTPVHQASATLHYDAKAGFDASLTARYAGRQFEDDQGTRVLSSSFVIDGYSGLRLKNGLRLIVRAENLLDGHVVSGISSSGIEDLGTPRTLWIGLDFAR